MTAAQSTTAAIRNAAQAVDDLATDTVPSVIGSGVDSVTSTFERGEWRRRVPFVGGPSRTPWYVGAGTVLAAVLLVVLVLKQRRSGEEGAASAGSDAADRPRRVA